MAITYPLACPTVTGFRAQTVTPQAVVGATRSPFTTKAKVQAHQGQSVLLKVTLPPLSRDEFAEWQAWRLKLNGMEGTFTLGAGGRLATPRGSAATTPGTPVIDGAGQTGNEIDVTGLPATATGYLKQMDLVSWGTGADARLRYVLDDVDTNASGEATLTLWPAVRTAPGNGTAVEVQSAIGLWRMTENQMPWDEKLAAIFGISFMAQSEV